MHAWMEGWIRGKWMDSSSLVAQTQANVCRGFFRKALCMYRSILSLCLRRSATRRLHWVVGSFVGPPRKHLDEHLHGSLRSDSWQATPNGLTTKAGCSTDGGQGGQRPCLPQTLHPRGRPEPTKNTLTDISRKGCDCIWQWKSQAQVRCKDCDWGKSGFL